MPYEFATSARQGEPAESRAQPQRVEVPPPVAIEGTFKDGDDPVPGQRFSLRAETEDGEAITPDNLGGGSTDNEHEDGLWIADDIGHFSFSNLPGGRKYYVEPEGMADHSVLDSVVPATACVAGGDGVIWAQLYDETASVCLPNTAYWIDVPGDVELEGTTDDEGILRHEDIRSGMYAIHAGEGEGNVSAHPSSSELPDQVRVRGITAPTPATDASESSDEGA